MAFPISPMDGQIYKNKVYRLSSNSWTDNTLVKNQIDISTSNGINIRSMNQTAPSGIAELFRVGASGLTTAGFFTLSATRGNFVHISNWSWSSNHQAVGYGTLNRLNNGNYSPVTVYLDVAGDGSVIISCNWGDSQGYQISIIKTAGQEVNFGNVNTIYSNPAPGYTRYSL